MHRLVSKFQHPYPKQEQIDTMKKSQLAAQLYTVRDFIQTGFDIAGSLEKIKKIGYDAVQVSAMGKIDESELLKICDGLGLKIIATHDGSSTYFDDLDSEIAHMKALNCQCTAYPWPHILPLTHTGAVLYARRLNAIAEKMAAAGLELSYHNHDIEFKKLDGEFLLDIIYREAPALKAELDVFWVAAAALPFPLEWLPCHLPAQDPVKWINKLSGRQSLIHLKDFGVGAKGGRQMRAIGDGNLDWKAIIPAAEAAGVKYFIVEQDDCNGADPFDELARSFEYISRNFISG